MNIHEMIAKEIDSYKVSMAVKCDAEGSIYKPTQAMKQYIYHNCGGDKIIDVYEFKYLGLTFYGIILNDKAYIDENHYILPEHLVSVVRRIGVIILPEDKGDTHNNNTHDAFTVNVAEGCEYTPTLTMQSYIHEKYSSSDAVDLNRLEYQGLSFYGAILNDKAYIDGDHYIVPAHQVTVTDRVGVITAIKAGV